MRPSQLLTVPGLLTWESNADAAACGINISNNGNVIYYGPSIGNGRHIVINCSYLLP